MQKMRLALQSARLSEQLAKKSRSLGLLHSKEI